MPSRGASNTVTIRTETIDRYRALTTAQVSDALFRLGTKQGTMDAGIKPVVPDVQAVGPAFTVKTYPGATHGSGLALQHAQPGDVVVIDGEGFDRSILWGGIFSAQAVKKGLAGTVIDGAVRDIDDVRELGYPLFARYVCPRAGAFEQQAEMQIPITCAGALVNPGDLIIGDNMGVVAVPQARVEEVLAKAEEIREKEERIMAELRVTRDA